MSRSLSLIPVALLLVACSADSRPPGIGGGGGGGGGGGSGRADAGDVDAPPALIRGAMCRLTDVRTPTACVAGDVSGIDVAVRGGEMGTSGASGEFSLLSPGGVRAVLDVATMRADIQTTVIGIVVDDGGAEPIVPVVFASDWTDLKTAIAANEPSGTATLAIYALSGLTPVAGAEVIAPTAVFAPYYALDSATNWTTDGVTSDTGAALVFGVPADLGTVDFTVVGPDSTVDVTGLEVTDGATTFVFVGL